MADDLPERNLVITGDTLECNINKNITREHATTLVILVRDNEPKGRWPFWLKRARASRRTSSRAPSERYTFSTVRHALTELETHPLTPRTQPERPT